MQAMNGSRVAQGNPSGMTPETCADFVATFPPEHPTTRQGDLLRLVTGSRYTHTGIVLVDEAGTHVIEAVEPVQMIDFDDWVARGKGGHALVMRARIGESQAARIVADARAEIGSTTTSPENLRRSPLLHLVTTID
jgi:hypothetical protein